MFWLIGVYVCMYLYITAVSREIELQDESGDVAAVNQSVQTRSSTHVINIHRVLHRTDCQQPPVRTEPAHTYTHLLFITFLTSVVFVKAAYFRLSPDVLNGDTAVSFLCPHLQRVGEEEEKLAVLHPHRQHLPVCAVAHTPGCVAQTHLVQQFLQKDGYR